MWIRQEQLQSKLDKAFDLYNNRFTNWITTMEQIAEQCWLHRTSLCKPFKYAGIKMKKAEWSY